MNIFTTSPCPVESAKFLDDKRKNKMLLESCQMLSTAVNLKGGKAPYKSTHPNHPCNIWVRESRANWNWLWLHAKALSDEYTRITGKIHKCRSVLIELHSMNDYIPDGDLMPFVNCARNKDEGVDFTMVEDVFVAYQLYLNSRWDKDKLEPKWS